MIKVKIQDKNHGLPTSWNEIRYGNYLKIIGASANPESQLHFLSAVTGIDEETLGGCSVDSIKTFYEITSFVTDKDGLSAYNVVDENLKVNIGDMEFHKFEACRNEINNQWRTLYPDKDQLSQFEINHVYMNAAPVFVKEYLDIEIIDEPVTAVYGLAVFFSILFKDSTTSIVN